MSQNDPLSIIFNIDTFVNLCYNSIIIKIDTKEEKEMRTVFFNLDKQFRELNQQSIDELKEVLESIGIELSINDKHQGMEFLSVILTDEFEQKRTRNAGRKNKSIKGWVTVEDIEKMIAEKTAEVVAKEFGISRATLFRKLKKAKEDGGKYLY